MPHILSHLAGQPVIAGAGLAGLAVALHLKTPCVVLSPAPLGKQTASGLAQGGIAASVGAYDSPERHSQDTLAAGAGLCDPNVVQAITAEGAHCVETLRQWGVPFAQKHGRFLLHHEAAHSVARIVYAGGDATGAAIIKTLVQRVHETDRITVLNQTQLSDVVLHDGQVSGVWTSAGYIPTTCCVIATGGAGALFQGATSPSQCDGSGIAVAARAGALLVDMEFTQFHPTVIDCRAPDGRGLLVSEAVRGAGAILVDESGQRFVDELQPRDCVSRAVAQKILCGQKVFLDARRLHTGRFSQIFPTIFNSCKTFDIDPDTDLIPVRPGMHYLMGGIHVDLSGRSSIPGLWACGEAACTGMHGANRLASNSLLEAFIMGRNVARDLSSIEKQQYPLSQPPTHQGKREDDLDFSHLTENLGILRSSEKLENILNATLPFLKTSNRALIAASMAWAALQRRESRGSHWRTDFPRPADTTSRHFFTINDLAI